MGSEMCIRDRIHSEYYSHLAFVCFGRGWLVSLDILRCVLRDAYSGGHLGGMDAKDGLPELFFQYIGRDHLPLYLTVSDGALGDFSASLDDGIDLVGCMVS